MSTSRRARDVQLLDALAGLQPVAVNATVWRVVRSGQNPVLGNPSAGRWDPGQFDVLYTCFDPHGAVSEMYYHLSRQPVFPSKIDFSLNEITVNTQKTLKFADVRASKPFGVEEADYAGILYENTQRIGDAAAFLDFDGIIAPSARWQCLNLTLFTNRIAAENVALKSSATIDWDDWKTTHLKPKV